MLDLLLVDSGSKEVLHRRADERLLSGSGYSMACDCLIRNLTLFSMAAMNSFGL